MHGRTGAAEEQDGLHHVHPGPLKRLQRPAPVRPRLRCHAPARRAPRPSHRLPGLAPHARVTGRRRPVTPGRGPGQSLRGPGPARGTPWARVLGAWGPGRSESMCASPGRRVTASHGFCALSPGPWHGGSHGDAQPGSQPGPHSSLAERGSEYWSPEPPCPSRHPSPTLSVRPAREPTAAASPFPAALGRAAQSRHSPPHGPGPSRDRLSGLGASCCALVRACAGVRARASRCARVPVRRRACIHAHPPARASARARLRARAYSCTGASEQARTCTCACARSCATHSMSNPIPRLNRAGPTGPPQSPKQSGPRCTAPEFVTAAGTRSRTPPCA